MTVLMHALAWTSMGMALVLAPGGVTLGVVAGAQLGRAIPGRRGIAAGVALFTVLAAGSVIAALGGIATGLAALGGLRG